MTVEAFVLSHLGPPPSRVIEVGCGDGELARALAARGYEMTAIDPEAPDGDIFRRTSLENFDEAGPFDTVVAVRSLHHVHDLEGGLRKIHSLLVEGGSLVLDEFAWDHMDRRTANWYLSHAPEHTEHDHRHESLRSDDFPGAWVAEHDGMHDSKSIRGALDRFFHETSFEWVPYLAPHYLERPDLVGEEEDLIRGRQINPMGYRYVGTRTARTSR